MAEGPKILDWRIWILDWRSDPAVFDWRFAKSAFSSLVTALNGLHDPGRKPLGYRRENHKVIHGYEDVAAIKEVTPQPGPAINLRAVPYGGISELGGESAIVLDYFPP